MAITALALIPAAGSAETLPDFHMVGENQSGLVVAPDEKSAYWVAWNGDWGSNTKSHRVIYMSHRLGDTWTPPAPAPFTANYSDDDPFVSPDGRWLYFVSDRPADDSDTSTDGDIWRYGLDEQHRLERLSINSESAEYSPVITLSGALYFASARKGGAGQGDIYRALPSIEGFHEVDALGPSANSSTGEWNVWVAPDESELIFEASSRSTNVSAAGDLYYSWYTPAGWTAAVPIDTLNSSGSDLLPRLHPDGQTLFYTTAPIGKRATINSTNWPQLRSSLRANYAPILLVANRSSHEVTFVDLSKGVIVDRIATGEGPHLLSNVSDGRVAATGFGIFPQPHVEPVTVRPPFMAQPNSRLTVIDTADRTVLLETVVEDCANPHASWLVEQRAYVTCEDEQRVVVIDLQDASKIGHFDTKQAGSHVLSFDPASRTLAASNTDSGSVTLINIDTGETRVVALGGGSEGAISFAGNIWVANAFDNSLSVVDPSAGEIIAHIDPLCQFPIALSQGRGQEVWVACFGSSELVAINTEIFMIKQRIPLEGQPLNLMLNPNRELAYVSIPRKNAIAEIDLQSGKELRLIRVGIEPDGLRWAD